MLVMFDVHGKSSDRGARTSVKERVAKGLDPNGSMHVLVQGLRHLVSLMRQEMSKRLVV